MEGWDDQDVPSGSGGIHVDYQCGGVVGARLQVGEFEKDVFRLLQSEIGVAFFRRKGLVESVTQEEERVVRADGQGLLVVQSIAVYAEEKTRRAHESPKRSREGKKLPSACGGVGKRSPEKIEEKDDPGGKGFPLQAGDEFGVQESKGVSRGEISLTALAKEKTERRDLECR